MRLSLVFLIVAAGVSLAASDPIAGKWKADPSRSILNDEMKVDPAGPNQYAITFAPNAVDTIVADGADQPALRGSTLSVTIDAPNQWTIVRKMNGKTLLIAYWTLSSDGQTLSDAYTGYRPDGSKKELHYLYQRTAGTAGFTGTWDSDSQKLDSAFELQIEPYQTDGISIHGPGPQMTQNIRFDGDDSPETGPGVAPGSVLSGRRDNPRTIRITEKLQGKITGTRQFEVSADLRTLTVTYQLVGQSRPKNILVFDRE